MGHHRDAELVQIVNAALADATVRARRSEKESWLACRVGCTACCHGVFRITALDAQRLRAGLDELGNRDQARAIAIRRRATEFRQKLYSYFPGDAETGSLVPEDDPDWQAFADCEDADLPCPVLEPVTGACELYAARPLTCRIFGPPVENEFGIGVCELCYVGAEEAEILAGEMHLKHQALEEELNREFPPEETIIAWALLATLT